MLPVVINTFVLSVFEWPFYSGFIVMLYLGSLGMDHVIPESFCNETVLSRYVMHRLVSAIVVSMHQSPGFSHYVASLTNKKRLNVQIILMKVGLLLGNLGAQW